MSNMLQVFRKNQFLFEELVKRDFKKKYKRAALGIIWSMLSPLLMLMIISIAFGQFFGATIPHYTIYVLAGQIIFSYYSEATNNGMNALVNNAAIFTKVNVPKYMFLLSINISSLINFALMLVIFFVFAFFDGIVFQWKFLLVIYPIICLILFNLGVGLILSAFYVFFKDVQYLYSVFLQLMMYASAIFYNYQIVPEAYQIFFKLNPVFIYISYIRSIVINNTIPSIEVHILAAFYALAFLIMGGFIYRRYNYKFLYYV